jgi:3-methyladenine DNA glycosylase/8-oxoguanine DNA glycosylase
MHEFAFRPRGPYLLAASAAPSDATRRRASGIVRVTLRLPSGSAIATVWQEPDGSIRARSACNEPEHAHDALRRILRIDADHRPFHRLAAADRLLKPLSRRMRGVVPLMRATPEHALVQAVCGQLIRSSEARRIERRVVEATSRRQDELFAPPTRESLCAVHGASFARAGLSSGRASLLHRSARRLPWPKLAEASTADAITRIRREPGLGPWSAGLIMLYGYGRDDAGLVDDLHLVRLCRSLGIERSADLLDRYAPWQGPASVWLMHHPLGADPRLL